MRLLTLLTLIILTECSGKNIYNDHEDNSTPFEASVQENDNQQDIHKPFRLLIIYPDNARIADSLLVWADSIEKKYVAGYYASIRGMEQMKEMGDKDLKRRLTNDIKEAKKREKEALTYKYYQSIADRTLYELSRLFNRNYSDGKFYPDKNILEGNISMPIEINSNHLTELGKQYDLDYIVYFENIHSGSKNGIGTINYTMTLYGAKSNEVILKTEIEGNAQVENFTPMYEILGSDENMFPHETGIHCDNYLECMLKSAIRFSTVKLYRAISEKQRQ